MFEIRVNKAELLATLRANLRKHRTEYNEAVEQYIPTVVNTLRDRANSIEESGEVNLVFNLPKPHSYEQEYKDAIEMLKWSEDDFIILDHQQFKQYIQDEWAWKNTFTATTQMYGR